MAGDSCGLVEPNDLQKDSIEGTAILGLGTTYIANTYSSLILDYLFMHAEPYHLQ